MAEVKEALRSGQGEFRSEEIIFAVEESPEGGYEAHALGYAIFTQADTMDELKAMVQDAVRCHFEDSSRPRGIRFQPLLIPPRVPRDHGVPIAAICIMLGLLPIYYNLP